MRYFLLLAFLWNTECRPNYSSASKILAQKLRILIAVKPYFLVLMFFECNSAVDILS